MRRILFVTAAGAAAVVPAIVGLTGNPALSHQVPVRVPANVVPVSTRDLAPRADDPPGNDDRQVTPTSSTATAAARDDNGRTRTRTRTRPRTIEPGDDHGGNRGGNDVAAGDDHGRNRHGGGDDSR
jgi:hypothetical protein